MKINNLLIGLCTYRRPEMLKNALDAVLLLTFPNDFSGIIIVDNDPDGLSAAVVDDFKKKFNYPVYFFVESRRGIVYARQRVLDEANGLKANALAFFDDDAIPDRNWLDNLYSFYQKNRCDVATGEQIENLLPDAADWIKRGRFFDRRKSRKEGMVLTGAATNNVLFSLDFVRRYQLSFDPRFNKTGGSDTDFFWQFHKRGAKILWTNTAIVRETVLPSRANFKWLFKRSLAMGARKYVHIRKEQKMTVFTLLLQTVLKFILGVIGIVLSLPFGRICLYRMVFKWARSLGMLRAIIGQQYQEYLGQHHGK